MTWASITSTGTGKVVGFRLCIEGWPEVWVSNPAITYATNKDTRSVRTGLLAEGLGFSERLNLQEARTIARGFTAKIVSTDGYDRATASFSTRASVVALLSSTISESATSLSCSAALTSGTYYHLGTETIKATSTGTSPSIERQKWNTHAQKQIAGVTAAYGDVFFTPIYDRPTTMEGRRANLFVYGEGDTLAGDGTLVFRGLVSRPPRLDSDGMTWLITVDPITHVLNQNVANTGFDARIYGIYHHKAAPVYMQCNYNGTQSSVYTVTGLHDNLGALIVAVNAQIATMLASIPATNVSSLVLDQVGGTLLLRMKTAATAPTQFTCVLGSPLLGFANATIGWGLPGVQPGSVSSTYIASTALTTSTEYVVPLGPSTPDGSYCPFAEVVTDQMSCLGEPTGLRYTLSSDTASPWRIYVDKDLTGFISAGEFIYLEGLQGFQAGQTPQGSMFETESGSRILEVSAISAAGTTCIIDFVPLSGNSHGARDGAFCTYDTTATGIRDYGFGDVSDLRDSICTQSIDGNYGDTPFITAAGTDPLGDMAAWVPGDIVASDPGLSSRQYQFATAKGVGEILREELKLIAHYMYLDANFRIAIRPFPAITQTLTSDVTITATNVVTPDGKHGMWPGWEVQRDGLVNEILVQQVYDPIEDEWTGKTYTFRELKSITEHKSRGKGRLEIKPFSRAWVTPDTAKVAATAIFGVLSKDYVLVTVEVPYTLFSTLVGDVVKLTHALIPAGDGTRGISGKRAIVFERRWNFTRPTGTFVLYVPIYDEPAYTPSAYVTAQVNNGSNNWTITASSANTYNIIWSQEGDGLVLSHFQATDNVEVIRYGDSGETRVAGTVASVDQDNDQIVVDFAATWTPSTHTWLLEWPKDTGSTATARQLTYCYVADGNVQLTSGDTGWRFV